MEAKSEEVNPLGPLVFDDNEEEEALSENDVDLLMDALSGDDEEEAGEETEEQGAADSQENPLLSRQDSAHSRFSFSLPTDEADPQQNPIVSLDEEAGQGDETEGNAENTDAQEPDAQDNAPTIIPSSSVEDLAADKNNDEDAATDRASFQEEPDVSRPSTTRSLALEAQKREMRKRRALEQAQQQDEEVKFVRVDPAPDNDDVFARPTSPLLASYDSSFDLLGRMDSLQ